MSQHQIVIDSVAYVRSRDAVRAVHFGPDYVSRLARRELIDGKLVEALWFVSLASLKDFIADQERQKEAWRTQLAECRREEQRLADHPSALAT